MVLTVLCLSGIDSICILVNELHFCKVSEHLTQKKVRITLFKSNSEEDGTTGALRRVRYQVCIQTSVGGKRMTSP